MRRRSGDIAGLFPSRYSHPGREIFRGRAGMSLSPGKRVLDIGSGRNPTIEPAERPSETTYVGLDLSATELAAAGPGAYDEHVVADAAALVPDLEGRFDLALSWQVLEHVRDLQAAVDATRSYLAPGGRFVTMFSGARSVFGLANRMLPESVGHRLVSTSMKRDPQRNPVFVAYYDRCTYDQIRAVFQPWSTVEIIPLYRGARYFRFSRTLARGYLAYENQLVRRGMHNWATHYLVSAVR